MNEKRVWIFFLSFHRRSPLLPFAHSALRSFFARCIFHHPKPFLCFVYYFCFFFVSKVLTCLAQRRKKRFLNVLKCMFGLVVFVLWREKNETKAERRKKKVIRHFYIMHILLVGTNFFLEMHFWECRGETSLDKNINFLLRLFFMIWVLKWRILSLSLSHS